MLHKETRGQDLTRFLALALWALRFQPLFFFFERSPHLEHGVTLLALVIVKRHSGSLLASGVIGKGGKIYAQQLADFAVDLAQKVDSFLLGLGIVHD